MSAGDGKHDCPKVGCPHRLDRNVLACKRHWFEVPAELRRELNRAWRSGDYLHYFELRQEVVASLNDGVIA